jgi:hypothetical protein
MAYYAKTGRSRPPNRLNLWITLFICFFFFLFTHDPIHLFEKNMNDAQTKNLGPVIHTLGM